MTQLEITIMTDLFKNNPNIEIYNKLKHLAGNQWPTLEKTLLSSTRKKFVELFI